MKRRHAGAIIIAALLSGCGGAGGVSTTGTPTLEIAARADQVSTVIYGVQLTVSFPAGVTVAADPADGTVSSDVLTPEVAGTTVGGRFAPATATTPATLTLIVANPTGFTVGEVVKVACQVAPGRNPAGTDFSATDFVAWSAQGSDAAPVGGITPEFGFRMQ